MISNRAMTMQLRGLRTFCTVSRHLSFKKAADELCLSASAISHQISDLEEELGLRLFERLTRSIKLTGEGARFYEEVQPLLEAIDEAAFGLRKQAHRTPLLVQMPEFFASEILMPIIAGFSEQHPDIDLRIESLDIGNATPNGADINVVLTRKTPVAARVEKLFPIYYQPACSKTLYDNLTRSGASHIDVLHEPTMLLHKARPYAWSRWARHAGLGNLKPKQIIYVDSIFALARAAQQGVGIAMLPMPVSRAWFDSGILVPLHRASLITEDYYWMTNDVSDNGAADTFWQWMLESLQRYRERTSELNSSVA